ncbi:MAG TPA: RNA 2',3'-cyclic phosphodiesterase [Bacillota bacterium]|nr:RNA 2',3'-cyclic phosphodiesterase [Bacillota bacterium]
MTYQAHYFLGIKVSEDTAQAIYKWVEHNKENLPFKNWVVPEDYHITLIFLGATTEEQQGGLSVALQDVAKQSKPFTLEVTHIGHFGLKEQPRVLWAGIEPSDELSILQQKILCACVPLGFRAEDRPYRPHITLARKWSGNEPFHLEKIPFHCTDLVINVPEIVLYRSHPDRTPKYEPISRFQLLNKISSSY